MESVGRWIYHIVGRPGRETAGQGAVGEETDSAAGWQTMTRVILPMMASTTAVVVVMAIINGLNAFDIVWVMTQGGPYRSSATLAVNMYREAFVVFKFGLGSANAVVLSLLVLAAAVFYLRVIFRRTKIGE